MAAHNDCCGQNIVHVPKHLNIILLWICSWYERWFKLCMEIDIYIINRFWLDRVLIFMFYCPTLEYRNKISGKTACYTFYHLYTVTNTLSGVIPKPRVKCINAIMSHETRQFLPQFVRANKRNTSRCRIVGLLWGEYTRDRWIPFREGR